MRDVRLEIAFGWLRRNSRRSTCSSSSCRFASTILISDCRNCEFGTSSSTSFDTSAASPRSRPASSAAVLAKMHATTEVAAAIHLATG